MAGSKHAQDLKDSYVNGIIDAMAGETPDRVDPQLAGALGMEQDQQAGVVIDAGRGVTLRKNDGIPKVVIRNGTHMRVMQVPGMGMPIPDQGFGGVDGQSMDSKSHQSMAESIYSGGYGLDYLNDASPDLLYQSGMRAPVTRQ